MENRFQKLTEWSLQGVVVGVSAVLSAGILSMAFAAFDFSDVPTNVASGSTLSASSWNDLAYRVNKSVKGSTNFQAVDATNQTPTMTCASWCDVTGVSLSLPSAGTYVVIFSADGYRNGGSRGDGSQIRLAWT
ncbi:MAG: hypothetical protein QG650_835 [Patescibacteria group bacterium]|nr:hypothetical protein [Patescibacteria group bacterium]